MKKGQVIILSMLGSVVICIFAGLIIAIIAMQSPVKPPEPAKVEVLPIVPMPTSTIQPTPQVIRFEGNDNGIFEFSAPAGSLLTYGWHIGDSNFVGRIFDKQGNFIGLVVNCIGDCEDERILRLPESGRYLLEVSADNSWTILIGEP